MRCTVILCLTFLFASCSKDESKSSGGLSPSEALKSFELPDEFQIELIASEPLISDPVAMEVDSKGNIYVVEMHGYPLDTKGSGVIKILTDTNNDGFPDKSTVFADSLILPNGIQCWKNGVIVTDVPDVLYFEDTNGDNIADIKNILLTGFARSNPQHNGNSPLFGLDNWIYIAHEGEVSTKFFPEQFGDSGGRVSFPGKSIPFLPRNANGRSVRFKPDSYQLEMLSSDSQYGHTFSPYGEHINTKNADHVLHEVLAAPYLQRNPAVEVGDVSQDISDHGSAAEVFPITKNPEHQLLTDVGVITSSCAVTWYGGGLFPAKFDNVTFIAEPVHNLVHADVIKDSGASFIASRLYKDKEFLASTDSWSRPVFFYNGPDGALYVVDYYRQIIEHPEWMSDEVIKSGALYNGSDKGRIYRISPKGTPKLSWNGKINLEKSTEAELVKLLDHKSLWWRKTAQRILLNRDPTHVHEILKNYFDSPHSPVGWVHALWLLDGIGKTDPEILRKALHHSEPGVRVNAIRISELHLKDLLKINSELIAMQNDPDARVRFQLVCTLGFLDSPEAGSTRLKILERDVNDPWVTLAVLSAMPGQEFDLIQNSLKTMAAASSEGKHGFYENAAAVIARSKNSNSINHTIDLALSGINKTNAWWKAALLNGLQKGSDRNDVPQVIESHKAKLIGTFSEKTPPAVRSAALSLVRYVGNFDSEDEKKFVPLAMAYASDKSKPVELREDAVLVLSFFPSADKINIARTLISADEPESVQINAMRLYNSISAADASEFLISRWNEFTPPIRSRVLQNMMRDTSSLVLFLAEVEKKKINHSTISWPQTVRLMNHSNTKVREWSRKLLAGESLSENEVLQKYGAVLEASGSREKGKTVFEKNCSICHQINDESGVAFGPDLASIKNRDARFILLDIVNPNRSIADGFELWTVQKKSGEQLSGIIASQTSTSIMLRSADGHDTVIPRSDIEKLFSESLSAMPQNISSNLSEEDLRNLITFLKN